MKAILSTLLASGQIRPINYAFAEFIYQQEPNAAAREQISLLAALVSVKSSEQHTCISIDSVQNAFFPHFTFVEPEKLKTLLFDATTCAVAESCTVSQEAPLVLDAENVYLQRYWHYEQQIVQALLSRAKQQFPIDIASFKRILEKLFAPGKSNLEPDWQKIAVAVAVQQSFSIITGGPGTGKTTTVAKLMAALQALQKAQTKAPLKIRLCAPTGKAAARLTESIVAAKESLPESYQQDLPNECSTIHRLLGSIPHSPNFKANAEQPLHLDVLIIDEASMVDVALMSKLIQALPTAAKLILLGDQQQLSSVEVGSVLSDICAAARLSGWSASSLSYGQVQQSYLQKLGIVGNEHMRPAQTTQLSNSLIKLWKSYRFEQNSGIGHLAAAINQGDWHNCKQLLTASDWPDISWYPSHSNTQIIAALMPAYLAYFAAIKNQDLDLAFALLQQQILLCARQQGKWGVQTFNRLIEQELLKQGVIESDSGFYPGKPIMLKQNQHTLGLFNGDIGIAMPDKQVQGLTKIWFVGQGDALNSILPHQLPEHDSLYAMTIHKSQGSEFTNVHLCFPQFGELEPIVGLSRELLYTGLTRAKRRFCLYASESVLMRSVGTSVDRGSGLSRKLCI